MSASASLPSPPKQPSLVGDRSSLSPAPAIGGPSADLARAVDADAAGMDVHIDSEGEFAMDDAEDLLENPITITITFRGQTESGEFPRDAVFEHLASAIEERTDIMPEQQKWMAASKGLIRPTTAAALARPLSELEGIKITVIGSTSQQVASLHAAGRMAQRREQTLRSQRKVFAAKTAQRRRYTPDDFLEAKYSFRQLAALPNLPDPARSKALLMRLAGDRGIRSAMRKFRLNVDTLTEMEPLSNTQTTHEGTTRLLGLNRNCGEVIELRLWTDAYDGFRDYNTIRRTLCHELAHNRHSKHDRAFWDFCHEIEREVHASTAGGRTLDDAAGPSSSSSSSAAARGSASRASATPPPGPWTPSREEDVEDHGGWIGGEYVLGRGVSPVNLEGLTKREILAMAAEARRQHMDDDDPNGGNQGSSSGSAPPPPPPPPSSSGQ